MKNGMRPIHPGEVLREDYLKPLGMSVNALAVALNVPAARIGDIVLERRGITVDTALRLARYFGGDVQNWMNLQTTYEIKVAEATLARKVEEEVVPMAKIATLTDSKESEMSEFRNGTTETTQIGYVNRNKQRCAGHRGVAGTDHGQVAYRMECLDCGHVYGANGSDVFQRKCPKCDGGRAGIPF